MKFSVFLQSQYLNCRTSKLCYFICFHVNCMCTSHLIYFNKMFIENKKNVDCFSKQYYSFIYFFKSDSPFPLKIHFDKTFSNFNGQLCRRRHHKAFLKIMVWDKKMRVSVICTKIMEEIVSRLYQVWEICYETQWCVL